jgi:hypothetical protein
MRDRVPPFKFMRITVLPITAVAFFSVAVCHGQQSDSDWMEERKRDWELDSLRSQAASLDPQRQSGIVQKIGALDWQRKSQRHSESDFMERSKMDWEVQRIKSSISEQRNEQESQERQRAREEEREQKREKQRQLVQLFAGSQLLPHSQAQMIERKEHEHFITKDEIEEARQLRDMHQFNYQTEEYWLNEIKRFNMMSEPDRRRIVSAANGTPLAFYLSLTPLTRVSFRPEMLSAP